MKARKENKVYQIHSETEKQRYLKEGYDIYDDTGEIIAYSPLKKIAYSEYARLKEENAELKKQLVESGSADDEDVKTLLASYAKEHGIDIGKASSVAGITKKIKEHQQEAGE